MTDSHENIVTLIMFFFLINQLLFFMDVCACDRQEPVVGGNTGGMCDITVVKVYEACCTWCL